MKIKGKLQKTLDYNPLTERKKTYAEDNSVKESEVKLKKKK